MNKATSILNRILLNSKRKEDCLVCYLGLDKDGYSQIDIDGKTYRTHRIIMNLIRDFPLNSPLEIHHNDILCKSKACIEYDHLSIGDAKRNASTRKEYDNNRRYGPSICSKHKINKSFNSARRLVCKECHREAQQKYSRKQTSKT